MTVSQINKKKFVTRGIFFIKKIRLFEILDKNPTIIFRENIDYLAIQEFFKNLKILKNFFQICEHSLYILILSYFCINKRQHGFLFSMPRGLYTQIYTNKMGLLVNRGENIN